MAMRSFLLLTGLQPGAQSTMYFDVFLKHKDRVPELFFKVDDFARRVHTPVCNFHRAYRPHLTIEGQAVASLDVTTMQPLILGKVLQNVLPNNEFSKWINAGEDIYIKLQTASGLQTRDEGKKRFFEIAFSPPSDALAKAFGNCEWVEWVNWYKCQHEPRNSHNKEKTHSNLAWLLQTTEVTIMRKIWAALIMQNIPFLSVHDEIVIKGTDEAAAAKIMHEILSSEFSYYKLNSKQQAETASGEYSYTIKKGDPQPPVHDEPVIGVHGYPASWDEPPTGINMAKIVAEFGNVMQLNPILPTASDKAANDTTGGANEWFSLQWFIDEAHKCFKRSMVKDAKDYYPAFIASYRPTLRRVGIDETTLRNALNL
jgi:hypothetical protein